MYTFFGPRIRINYIKVNLVVVKTMEMVTVVYQVSYLRPQKCGLSMDACVMRTRVRDHYKRARDLAVCLGART